MSHTLSILSKILLTRSCGVQFSKKTALKKSLKSTKKKTFFLIFADHRKNRLDNRRHFFSRDRPVVVQIVKSKCPF